MIYYGNFKRGAVIRFRFNTLSQALVPTAPSVALSLAVYKNSTAEFTTGLTPTSPFDNQAGLHLLTIDTSDPVYAVGEDYDVFFTAGTVDGIDLTRVKLFSFSLENRLSEVDVTKIAGQTANASAAVTFPASVANETTVSSRASQTSVDGKPTLIQIEGSSVLAKESTVAGRPTLNQIEASTVLAKEATCASILTAIQNLNNLSAKVNIFGSPLLEIPDSGSTVYAFTVIVKDDEDKLVNLDASPTITAANASGTSRSANLSAVANPSSGRYTFTYTVASTHAAESLRISVSGTVSGEARYIEWIGAVVNYDTLTVLQQISTDLAGKPNLAQIEASTILAKEATVSSRASQASVDGKPTLGQIEASTVLAKEQSVSSLIDRLGAFTGSGANTVLGFFRALMRKDAGAPTPSDIGGTFSNATDSLEAIRDRGDSAWTTGAGGGGGGGDPWATDLPAGNYTANQAGGILQEIVAKTNTIQSGKVAYAGPVTAKGTVDQIVIGDDYLTAHGTAFVWTIPAIPGMSAADVTVHFGGKNGASVFAVTGTAADIGSGKWSLTVQMPRATSGQLIVGEYRYSVAVHNAASVELTKIYYDDPLVAVEKFTP